MGKTFIIAELSANHNGSKKIAIDTIRAIKQAGADAVKLQTYTADTITLNSHRSCFCIKGGLWDGRYLYDLYKEAYTPWEWHEELFQVANEEGLVCFSSPFDNTAVDFLETVSNPIYKIASFEITDVNLIAYAASKGKPMLISTGVATEDDIRAAVEACRYVGNNDITLLKCTSAYPAPIKKANLLTIPDMGTRFGVKVGVSDHSTTDSIPLAAVALGARVVEKHFIIDRKFGGADSGFSLEPAEFRRMVDAIRETERALGVVNYPDNIESATGRDFARSLFITQNVKKGDCLTLENLRSVRPGCGLHPRHLNELLGRRVNCDVEAGEPMSWSLIEK